MNKFIGCSGYYYNEWKRIFYPEDIFKKNWLNFYCSQFNTLEVNSTFYNFPSLKKFQNWYKITPEHYQLTIKAPRIITHYRKFNNVEELILQFYDMTRQGLQEKLACILFQLPPSYHYQPERLDKIISLMDRSVRNILEFRHPSWWCNEVYEKLKTNDLYFCSISHPTLPSDLIDSGKNLYIRFHGVPLLYGSEYSEEEMLQWAEKIKNCSSAENCYIYFNNTMNGHAISNAKNIRKDLGE